MINLLELEKPKVIVILNFYTQSIDLLDFPKEAEDEVMNSYDGNVESYLSEKHDYPTSNICYMQTTWEKVDNQIRFAMPSKERERINGKYPNV